MTDRDPIEQLADEFVERYRRGERPPISEYTRKYPEHAERIEMLLGTLVLMEQLASDDDGDPRPPAAGDGPVDASLRQLGEFRVLQEVGRGGMGIVYEAEQESLGRRVALKVLPFHGLLDPTHLKRFRREARAAAGLHHSNIVPVFEVGEHDGVHYYAMQFIHGQGLDEVLSEVAALRHERSDPQSGSTPSSGIGDVTGTERAPSAVLSGVTSLSGSTASGQHYFRSVARLGAQVADALAYAHEQGVLHRDVKPSNLMLDTEGTVWITDFGLAKIDAKEDLTHTGDLVGTLRYMAPERFDGWSDPRSDIYGLGLTLYELLTLRPAFDESNRARLIRQITTESITPPRRVDRSIPVDLETIVLKSTSAEPGDRYASATELADDLRRFVGSRPIEARRTTTGERVRMWCRRNPAVAGLIGAVAILLIAVAAGTTIATVLFRGQRNQALAHLGRAEAAEQAATESADRERAARVTAQRNLYASRLAQARAGRWSDQMGRRFEGLDALAEAARLARELDLGEQAILQLRNEAIACMALVDLRLEKVWPHDGPPISGGLVYDGDLEQYARLESDGDFHIRRMDDNAEVARLTGFGRIPAGGNLFLRFSPDGRYFAAKRGLDSTGSQVQVWDVETEQVVFRGSCGGKTFYRNLDFSPDGRLLAYFTPGGTIGLRDIVARETLDPIPCERPLTCLRFAPGGRRIAAVVNVPENARGHVLIFDLLRREVVQTLEHKSRIDLAAWGPNGATLATPCFDGSVCVWEVATGRCRPMSAKHGAQVRLADYSPTGNLLVSVASEPRNRLWDPRTGRQLLETEQALKEFSRDGRWLSSHLPSSYAAVRLEVAGPRECRTLVGHAPNSEGVSLSFSPNGRLLASATVRGSVRIWDVAGARELAAPASLKRCRFALFESSGRSLVTVGDCVAVWPLNSETVESESVLQIGPPAVPVSSRVNWRRPGPIVNRETTLAFPSSRGEILLVDAGGTSPPAARRTGRGGNCVSLSPCGTWFATGARNRSTIEVCELATGRIATTFSAPRGSHVQFSPDGNWLVGSLRGGSIVFWRVGSWQESHRFRLDGRGFSRMAFSQDCQLMAVTDSFHVTLLDPASGREIARLASPYREQLSQTVADATSGIVFSPDDSTLAVGSDDGPIQLWDLRLIRRQLDDMGLDWHHAPPARPASSASDDSSLPLRVEIIGAESIRDLTAVVLLSEALQDDPTDFDALMQRVKFLWKLRKYEEMIPDAERMIQLLPSEHYGLVWRAFPRMMLRRYEEAIRDYQQALAMRPDNPWPMRHLAWMFLTGPDDVRDLEQARALARQAVRLKRVPLFLTTLGAVCFRQGEFGDAQTYLEAAASSAIDDDSQAVRLLFLAMAQQRLGNPADARQSYDQALLLIEKPVSLAYFRPDEIEALRSEAGALLLDERSH